MPMNHPTRYMILFFSSEAKDEPLTDLMSKYSNNCPLYLIRAMYHEKEEGEKRKGKGKNCPQNKDDRALQLQMLIR